MTDKKEAMRVGLTEEQYERWTAGELLQNVAPNMTPDDREYLISGTTPDFWEYLRSIEDDEVS